MVGTCVWALKPTVAKDSAIVVKVVAQVQIRCDRQTVHNEGDLWSEATKDFCSKPVAADSTIQPRLMSQCALHFTVH